MRLNLDTYKNLAVKSLGIGLTNRCNLNCAHCYSRNLKMADMSLNDIKGILNCFPNLQKVNFGTGETIFCPNFLEVMNFLKENKIKMALTTNGLTVKYLDDKQIKNFKDVDVSLDFSTAEMHDGWRGINGTFENAIRAIERCCNAGVHTSIAMALMNINYKHLPNFRSILDRFGISLRINIYKPVYTDEFELSYSQFWQSMQLLAENFKIVSISEPILSVITDITSKGYPCGNSLRIHPDLYVTNCIYLNPKKAEIIKFNLYKAKPPQFCEKRQCPFLIKCQGGCLGRRILQNQNGANGPDKYCPFVNNRKVPNIHFEKSTSKTEFIHANYLCTIIAN
ncbi:MAG: radical SAM protein [bacterium]|nr:radical SAM protein [bacterium]